jgi:hypothetical protein
MDLVFDIIMKYYQCNQVRKLYRMKSARVPKHIISTMNLLQSHVMLHNIYGRVLTCQGQRGVLDIVTIEKTVNVNLYVSPHNSN